MSTAADQTTISYPTPPELIGEPAAVAQPPEVDPYTRDVMADRHRAGDSVADLADDYGLSEQQVEAAVEQPPTKRERWAEAEPTDEECRAPRRRHRWTECRHDERSDRPDDRDPLPRAAGAGPGGDRRDGSLPAAGDGMTPGTDLGQDTSAPGAPLPTGTDCIAYLELHLDQDPRQLRDLLDALERWRIAAREQRARSILGSAYRWPQRRGRRHG